MKVLFWAMTFLLITLPLIGKPHDIFNAIKSLNNSIARNNFELLSKVVSSINATNDNNQTALHLAAQAGDLLAVTSLLQLGANPYLVDTEQRTPFDYAEQQTEFYPLSIVHLRIVSLLLEKMNGINAIDQGGWSPLLWSIAAGDHQRVKELFDAGATFTLWGNNGIASLARQLQDKEILKIIEAQPMIATPSARLLLAVETDNQPQVERLIAELKEDNEINNLFLYSLSHGHYDAAWILSEHLSDINAMLDFYGTPLQHSINAGQLELAHTLLVQHGANPNLIADNGHSPLMDAIRNKHFNFAQTLLDYGADASYINQGHSSSLSAFSEAIISGELELTRRIIEVVGDVNRPIRGRLPMLIATNQGNTEMLQLLITYGGDVNLSTEPIKLTSLHLVTCLGNIEHAQLLLHYGAEINAVNSYGNTPLMTATLIGLPEMVQFLLEQGADHRLVNKLGRTALDIARSSMDWGIEENVLKIINLLEKAG